MRKRLGIFMLTLLAALGWQTPAYSQDTRSQEARRARLQKEIAILDEQIRSNASQSANALSRLTLISGKVNSRKKLIEESDRMISEYSDSIAVKEKEIKALTARMDTLSYHYAKLVRGAYVNRSPKVWYMYILASDDVGQAFRRYGYLRDLSKQMNVQASKIKEVQSTLERESEVLSSMRKEAESIRAQRMSEMSKLQAEENDSRMLVNKLKKNKRKYQQDISKKQREVEALNREIARIIREATEDGKSGKKVRRPRSANLSTTPSPRSSRPTRASFRGRLKGLWSIIRATFPSGLHEPQASFQQRCQHRAKGRNTGQGRVRRSSEADCRDAGLQQMRPGPARELLLVLLQAGQCKRQGRRQDQDRPGGRHGGHHRRRDAATFPDLVRAHPTES